MNKNIYRQADSRWASLPYPKGSTFGGCGCGCCACLHVLIELDKYTNWTPKDLRPYMVNQGFAIKNQGTLWAGITKTLQHYGFSVINHPNMTSVWNTLKDRKYKFGVILFRSGTRGGVTWTTGGQPAIALSGTGGCTRTGGETRCEPAVGFEVGGRAVDA